MREQLTNTLGHSCPNYTGHAKIGCLYDPARSRKEIAIEVRRQLANYYPAKKGYKFSVTCSRGRSIDISIKAVPFKIVNPKYDPYIRNNEPRYNEAGADLLKQCEAILEAYNYSDMDGMIDYFDVNYYTHVAYDYSIENAEYADIKIRTQEPVII